MMIKTKPDQVRKSMVIAVLIQMCDLAFCDLVSAIQEYAEAASPSGANQHLLFDANWESISSHVGLASF